MGVDILYFLNHDLKTDTAENFLVDFKSRINGKDVILYDCEKQSWTDNEPKNGVWYILYNKSFESNFNSNKLDLFYKDDNLQLDLALSKNTVCVFEMKIDGKDIPAWCRWYTLCNVFEKNSPYNAKEWVHTMVENYKKYLVPIFHSTKVLLTADSSSLRHETLGAEFLREKGMTIEDALEKNKEFNPPCKVFKNDAAFGRKSEDYYDEQSENPIGALFLFDL